MAEKVVPLLMRQAGFWLPAYDADDAARLVPYMRKMAKDAVMSSALARRHRLCIQAGGHIGIWPLALGWMYERVMTFEPQPAAFQALLLNTAGQDNITACNAALGRNAGEAGMQPGADSGTWRTVPGTGHRVVTIDSLELQECDAIYLDLEGGEPDALLGAEKTIRRLKPVLHVEILPRSADAIRAVLASMEYRFVSSVHKDSIYVPA